MFCLLGKWWYDLLSLFHQRKSWNAFMCRVIFHTNAERGFSKSGSDLFRIKETQNRKIQKYINTNDTEKIHKHKCYRIHWGDVQSDSAFLQIWRKVLVVNCFFHLLYCRTEYQIYVYLWNTKYMKIHTWGTTYVTLGWMNYNFVFYPNFTLDTP